MFCNPKNFSKIFRIANSCISKTQVRTTFNLVNEFRRIGRLTEFEYLEVEKILLEKIKVDTNIS